MFEKKMQQEFIKDPFSLNSDHIPLTSAPICYDSEIFASTSKTYLSHDLKDPAHQKNIFEELTMQLLWAFNIPTDNEDIIEYVRKAIEYRIRE